MDGISIPYQVWYNVVIGPGTGGLVCWPVCWPTPSDWHHTMGQAVKIGRKPLLQVRSGLPAQGQPLILTSDHYFLVHLTVKNRLYTGLKSQVTYILYSLDSIICEFKY